MTARRIQTTGVAALVAVVVAVLTAGWGAAARPLAPAPARPAGASITLTSKTVLVPRSIVNQYLVGISKDRTTFRFKRAAGPLARLKVGSALVLEGSAAAVVTKISHSRGALIVKTREAALKDIVKSAHIRVSEKPDFAHLVPIYPAAPIGAHGASDFVRPTYPYVDTPTARKADGSWTFAGSASLYGFSVTFTKASTSRLDISGTLCFQKGSVCSNGTSNGLSAEVNFKGFIDLGKVDAGLTVNGGAPADLILHLLHVQEHGDFNYAIGRGTGGEGNPDPPVLHLPVGVGFPIIVGGVLPIYVRLQLGLLLKLGVTSHNATIRGGASGDLSGSETISESGGKPSDSASGNSGDGSVKPQQSISPGAVGVVVALQLPKVGIGLGIDGANGIAYVDYVYSIGQAVGSAIGGQFCSNYDLYLTIGGGFELQLGPVLAASPKHTFLDRHIAFTEPGCPRGG